MTQTSVVTRVVGPNDGLLFELQPKLDSAFDTDVADTRRRKSRRGAPG